MKRARISTTVDAQQLADARARLDPTEVPLGQAEGLTESVANLDNLQLLPVDRLFRRAGAVAPSRWPEFCTAARALMAC